MLFLKKGFHAFIYIYYTQMFQPDWLILRFLPQSFEIERSKGHISEVVVHLFYTLSYKLRIDDNMRIYCTCILSLCTGYVQSEVIGSL